MSIEQIFNFIVLAETLSFTKASGLLHMSQSALSRCIKNMEEILDVQLFERSNRSVQITYAGKLFLKEAKMIMLHYDKIISNLSKINAVLVSQNIERNQRAI